ncbi:hypothetical protein DL546_007197 [Coniochaeta pulveracea]|uniref:MYND-type domain-containing protein n=1 Tax=Coniochaeta pulveracea TaxID=177199 RepID=A0A420Y975_9PEZI|nr:hypothetical protein DL546_007197 [Coniochaeta pulveracea]
MPPPPDFTSTTLFPSLSSIPLPSIPTVSIDASDLTFVEPPTLPKASDPNPAYYLLAEVKHNMTITKPTLICKDRDGVEFALTFNDEQLDLKARGLKKGNCVVVPNARLIPSEKEGGSGYVQVFKGEGEFVRGLPGGLEGVVRAGRRMREAQEGRCWVCAKREAEGEEQVRLRRCTGCGVVRYCSKECQTRDWSEGGHRGECKVMKGIREIWPDA